MTDHSREVLSRIEANSDCTVRCSDGKLFRLNKSSLAEHSNVLGRMIRELDTETEFRVQEEGETFALLLDVIYSRTQFSAKSPITMHNLPAVLELARKYDVGSAVDCDHVLCQTALDPENVGETYALASKYGLHLTSVKCRTYAATNFGELTECFAGFLQQLLITTLRHPNFWPKWLDDLTDEEQIRFWKERTRKTHVWRHVFALRHRHNMKSDLQVAATVTTSKDSEDSD